MSRLTLRLPETLHHQLAHLAEGEGVSLNQYITYALTRQVSLAYSIQPIADGATQQQKEFAALLQALKQGSGDEAKLILASRESVDPEADLSVATDRFQQNLRPAEKAEQFRQWIASFPKSDVGIPAEALHRESIYDDRGV
jgi:hypothetical protein